jgi:uncharacterized protein (TIGR03790 family)
MGPHEVALIVNEASTDSVAVANAYARLRSIPECNVVRLRLPAALTGAVAMSPAEFTEHVWAPVREHLAVQGLGDQVLAWVFSCDFPTRVTATPAVSLAGLVFLRNRMPDAAKIENGAYASPLFAGPVDDRGKVYEPQSLSVSKRWLPASDMPIPAMMLGYTRERGNPVEAVIRGLERSAAADGTMPTGTVFLVTNGDVRSTCRDWQFASVAAELKRMGRVAVVTNQMPAGRKDIIGLMTGAASLNLPEGSGLMPGSIAEHLTSFAAAFDNGDQTKLSMWIGAGAAASSGTVTEPMSNWLKFPTARIFVYQAAGCAAIESFCQAIRCPLQQLVVGDPLSAPYAPVFRVKIQGELPAVWSGDVAVRAESVPPKGMTVKRYLWLVDGRPAGEGVEARIEMGRLSKGEHRLRVVAYTTGTVQYQAFDEKTWTIGSGK